VYPGKYIPVLHWDKCKNELVNYEKFVDKKNESIPQHSAISDIDSYVKVVPFSAKEPKLTLFGLLGHSCTLQHARYS